VLKTVGYLSGRMQVPVPATTSDADPCHLEGFCSYEGLFRPPVANHIDDASHRCAARKPSARIDPACKKQVASPVYLSPERAKDGGAEPKISDRGLADEVEDVFA